MAHELAKAQAKRFYGGVCVFTGLAGIDGAHIVPAGDSKLLADFPQNIVPAVTYLHALFDSRVDGSRRPVSEKIWMLRNLTLDEVRPRINKALRLLALRCEILRRGKGHNLYVPDPEAPPDEKVLRNWQDRGGAGSPVTHGVSTFSEVQADL